MSLLSSNGVSIEDISIKGLHNRSIKLLKSISEGGIPPQAMLHFMERQENNKCVLKSMILFIPRSIMDNPELTDENIQVNLDAMSDPIKEKDYIL